MADLKDVISDLDINIEIPTQVKGKKRRWYIEDEKPAEYIANDTKQNEHDLATSLKQNALNIKKIKQFLNDSKANEIGQIQREHKENTKGLQRDYKGVTKETQREHKGVTKGTLKGTHKGTQREHKYSQLRGWNKKIVDLIHDICKETVSRITYPLTNNAIADMLAIPPHSIKTTMQRLKAQKYILVHEYVNGRGGWSRYTLSEEFFTEIPLTERAYKGNTKGTQREHKLSPKGNTQGNTQGNTNSSSSSSNNIKTTTREIPEDWNFDISAYAKFGFTQSHIKQLIPLGLSPIDVEQMLCEFNYDFERNALPKIYSTPIGFLMGLFRKGQPYCSEGYRKAEDALNTELARRAETKQKNLLEEKFKAWEANLTAEEREEAIRKLPPHLMILEKTYGMVNNEVRAWYLNYFTANIVNRS